MSLWRRFFDLKDQEEEERLETIERALEEDGLHPASQPIRAAENVAARRELLAESYRQMGASPTRPTMDASLSRSAAATSFTTPAEVATSPNLLVPRAEGSLDYICLAQ